MDKRLNLLAIGLMVSGCQAFDLADRTKPIVRTDTDEVILFVERTQLTLEEGREVRLNVSAHYTGQTEVNVRAQGLPEGATFSPDSGKFVWTPGVFDGDPVRPTGLGREYRVEFIASAKNAQGVFIDDRETVSIFVRNMNAAPIAEWTDGSGDVRVSPKGRVRLAFRLSDPDANPDRADVRFEHSGPAGSRFRTTEGRAPGQWNGTFRWRPSQYDVGTHIVQFTITDRYGATAVLRRKIEVEHANRPPLVTSPSSLTTFAGARLTFALSAIDPDGDDYRFQLVSQRLRGMSFNRREGRVFWDVPLSYANTTQVVKFEVRERRRDNPLVVQATTTIRVRPAPNHVPEARSRIDEDFAVIGEKREIPVEVSDQDGDATTLVCESGCSSEVELKEANNLWKIVWSPTQAKTQEVKLTPKETQTGIQGHAVTLELHSVSRLNEVAAVMDRGSLSSNSKVRGFVDTLFKPHVTDGVRWIDAEDESNRAVDFVRRKWLVVVDRANRRDFGSSKQTDEAISDAVKRGANVLLIGSNSSGFASDNATLKRAFHLDSTRRMYLRNTQEFNVRWPATQRQILAVTDDECSWQTCTFFTRDRMIRNQDEVQEWLTLEDGTESHLMGIWVKHPSGAKRALMVLDPYSVSDVSREAKWKGILNGLLF